MSDRTFLDRAIDGEFGDEPRALWDALVTAHDDVDCPLDTMGFSSAEMDMLTFDALRERPLAYIVERRREERRLKAEVERLTERLAAIGAWMEESGVGWDPMRKKVTKTPRRAP